ncbi:MAG: hypothetical protein U0746_04250 [Gemmataceae bacterium]
MSLLQTLLTLAVCGAPPADDAPPLPFARATAAYVRCLAALEDMYEPRDKDAIVVAQRAFLDRLDKLLEALGADKAEPIARTEGRSLAGKLVAIARDRRLRPDVYEDVERAYGSVLTGVKPVDQGMRYGPDPQYLLIKHTDERYRLVWEFRLLASPAAAERSVSRVGMPGGTEGAVIGARMPPTREALRRIGNEASVVSLVFYFRHTYREWDGGFRNGNAADEVLELLEAHPTPRGLKAILDCAEWWETNQGPDQRINSRRKSLPANWVADLMPPGPANGFKWRRALAELPDAGLTDRQREMVSIAKKAARLP